MRNKNLNNIKVISIQVAPQQPKPEKNEKNRIIAHLKQIFVIESLIGINRLYLLNSRRLFQWMGLIYGAILIIITIYFSLHNRINSASYIVVRDTNYVEFIVLIISSKLTTNSGFKRFFDDLYTFDVYLNIHEDLAHTSSKRKGWLWIAVGLLHSLTECVIIMIYAPQILDHSLAWTYITLLTHDLEQFMLCILLRMIMNRVMILKTYVVKTFSTNSGGAQKKLNEFEALSNKAQLDISSLHRNYELLHKCAEQLNSIMNLPMILMLFCSGLSTTMLLKSLFRALQGAGVDITRARVIVIFCVSRCFKYTVLVIIPCYLSSVTTSQVTQMRTVLHDALNTAKIDKIERRRVKAFFQLTRENEFAYALWGVIRLNMSLPLSYLSLCTTYLVIIIQFSKFID